MCKSFQLGQPDSYREVKEKRGWHRWHRLVWADMGGIGWYGLHGLVWVAWADMDGIGWYGLHGLVWDYGWHGVTTMASPLYSVVDRMKKVQPLDSDATTPRGRFKSAKRSFRRKA
jgi:hypothetical protein